MSFDWLGRIPRKRTADGLEIISESFLPDPKVWSEERRAAEDLCKRQSLTVVSNSEFLRHCFPNYYPVREGTIFRKVEQLSPKEIIGLFKGDNGRPFKVERSDIRKLPEKVRRQIRDLIARKPEKKKAPHERELFAFLQKNGLVA